jgi:hypothetical protein
MITLPFFQKLVRRDFDRYDGVLPIQVYLLRLVFLLTFLFVGMDAWTTIFAHEGEWKPLNAVAFSVWAAYSTMSVLGVIRPLKMLPIVVFQIFYKTVWLCLVAYPLWIQGKLIGSPVEEMTKAFLWVILPIIAMPWRYFFRSFMQRKITAGAAGSEALQQIRGTKTIEL